MLNTFLCPSTGSGHISTSPEHSRQKVVAGERYPAADSAFSDHLWKGLPETLPSHWHVNCDAGVTECTFDATQG